MSDQRPSVRLSRREILNGILGLVPLGVLSGIAAACGQPAAPAAPTASPGELGTGEGADHTAGYKNLVWHPDLAGPYLFEAPALDGRLPFMEIKVGYYLSDLTQRNSGAICLVPGSHRRPPQELREMNHRVPEDQYIELNVPANTALVWRTQVWHCVTPNLFEQGPQGILCWLSLPLVAAD